MRFSRLRLSGFKSFVDPTELLIEPGLTGVVGPNGCGKSNLLEALRWVMGENRAKSLRGTGMDDVIFAGTDKLAPRNFAEVTLVIDNVDRNAPAGFNDEDFIEVTRRIERESGSAYRINGKDVRQKDVQLLFADAATGAHSPALVSQGRIGTLINAKPQDRRAILEEASGISGLHTRRKDAESKLKSAEGNLVRVQDVIQAMDGQISSLKRQARQAVRYKEVAGDIQRVEASGLYLKWQAAAEDVIRREQLLRESTKQVAEAQAHVAAATSEQTDVAAIIPDLRNKDAEAAAALQRLRIQKENLEAETARREELAASLEALLSQSKSDIEREQEIAADAKSSLDRLAAEQKRLLDEQNSQSSAETEAAEQLEEKAAAASEAERAYDQLSQQMAEIRARRSSLESDQLAVGRRLEQITVEKQRLTNELETLEATDKAAAQVRAAKADITAKEAALVSVNILLGEKETETVACKTAHEALANDKAAMDASVKTLEGEVASLEKLLSQNSKDGHQPVAEKLVVQPGFERAIGAVLGDDLDASEHDNDRRFWAGTDNPASSPIWPAGVEPISNFVSGPSALQARLTFIGVVAEDADGRALAHDLAPGQRLVDRSGNVWRWDGFVATASAPSVAAMRLEQKNRLNDLRGQLNTEAVGRARLDEQLAAAQASLNQARTAEAEARNQRQDTEKALGDARRALVSAEAEAAKSASRIGLIRDTLARNASDGADIEKRMAAIQTSIAELAAQTGLDDALSEKRQHVEALREELAKARSKFDTIRREAQGRADRLRVIDGEYRAWSERVTSADAQVVSLIKRQEDASKQLAALRANPEETEARAQKLLDALEQAETNRRESADKLVSAENTLRDKDRALAGCQTRLTEAREKQIRGEGFLENATSKRKDIAALIGERFECAPTHLLEKVGVETSDSLPDISVLDEKLEKLKRERDRLGAVNLRADEELADISEQRDHLISEREDLEAAIARLRHAINGLNREGRERLLKAFDVVNSHFGELFTTLFGGGEAHLELTESDDPLNAGLEIFASPPGKKLQSLSLLSGGEQALTALALIFAVFITNPAPICVLDEVDAPLDDANVERFCNLLDNMMERTDTRFLIVTHNAVSMARMRRLFGVTMAQRGISTLVSVDLERAEAFRDTA